MDLTADVGLGYTDFEAGSIFDITFGAMASSEVETSGGTMLYPYGGLMFAIGRLPGWISQWKESIDDPKWKLQRPRQIYTGSTQRDYVPVRERG